METSSRSKALKVMAKHKGHYKGDLKFIKTGNLSGRKNNPDSPKPKQNMSSKELNNFFK
jgi:hypothetical protein